MVRDLSPSPLVQWAPDGGLADWGQSGADEAKRSQSQGP